MKGEGGSCVSWFVELFLISYSYLSATQIVTRIMNLVWLSCNKAHPNSTIERQSFNNLIDGKE